MKPTISLKILICIGIITFSTLMGIGYSVILMRQQAVQANILEKDVLPLVGISTQINEYTSSVTTALQDYSLKGDSSSLDRFRQSTVDLQNQIHMQKTYVADRPKLSLDAKMTALEKSFETFRSAAEADIQQTGKIYALVEDINKVIGIILENTDSIYLALLDAFYADIQRTRPSTIEMFRALDHSGSLVDQSNYLQISVGDVLNDFSVPHFSAINSNFADMAESAGALSNYIPSSDAERTASMKAIQTDMVQLNTLILTFNDNIVAIAPLRRNTAEASADMTRQMSEFASLTQEMLRMSISQTNTKLSAAVVSSVILGLFILIIATAAVIYLRTTVIKKINQFVVVTKALTSGDGDLTKLIPVTGQDELASLAEYFNHFVMNVKDIILEAKIAADGVASGNSELAATMENLSSNFDGQAKEVSALVGHIDGVSSASKGNSEDLSRNHEMMDNTIREAAEGNKELRAAMVKMGAIHAQTISLSTTVKNLTQSIAQIEAILKTINGIADQTNLLALNAAIEAARAGDAGKGFAVVADEVRSLAEHTQSATQEINKIIVQLTKDSQNASQEMENSTGLVEEGVSNIDETNKVFTGIAGKMQDAGGNMDQINRSIAGQYQTIATVQGNAQLIAGGIEKSNIAVSEVVSTIGHLQERAERLKMLVSRFKTE